MTYENGRLCIRYNGTLECEPGALTAEPKALAVFPHEKCILSCVMYRKPSCLSTLITTGYCSPLAEAYPSTRGRPFLSEY